MASFCNVSIMTFFLLATGAFLASPGLAFEANEQDLALPPESSSSDDEDLLSSKDIHSYLVHCRNKIGPKCGPLFFRLIFLGESSDMFTSCCEQLINIGVGCHNALTNSISLRPEFSDKGPLYHKNRVHVWRFCNLLM
ncbi:hypothetical protein AAG906_004635 [Vitis piasezkii]